ncbi:beta-hexosaminidase subunit beta-like isoform X1 [Mizuhopecten yessoensis]|uniref:beta-hexosaminidase subunit beta-like isoform X1 n=2 Tax=Mizuhopecten yessoensis TaxID=6573 RepID=UPI000B45AE05|nr:beta-hexosaminidase subunit beta-like isoform X1 [Mizuhopecten yessoensis]
MYVCVSVLCNQKPRDHIKRFLKRRGRRSTQRVSRTMMSVVLRLSVMWCLLDICQSGPVFRPVPDQGFILKALAEVRQRRAAMISDDGNGEYIKWKQLDGSFGVEFAWGSTRSHIKRALRSTQGEPWPKPQVYKTRETIFTLNPTHFKINVDQNIKSDVISEAINRYNRTVFENAIQITEENFRNAPKSEVNKEMQYERDELGFINADRIRALTIQVNFTCDVTKSNRTNVSCDIYPSLTSDESYTLIVNSTGIFLSAQEVWGVVHGLETFSQLVLQYRDQFYIKETIIEDFPRFPHRGVLIDSSRHYIQKEVILDVLEGMAMNKMNVLHWHLTDEQSFSYKSDAFPDFSQKGAYHPNMVYTRDDINDVIAHARLRGIRVIPEFDVPGHTYSWGLSYPKMLTQCYFNNIPVPGFLGPLDPTNEHVFKILSKLFEEVTSVFKDRFVHLGGDEVNTECWASNPKVVELFQALFIKDNLRTQLSQSGPNLFTNITTNMTDNEISNMLQDKIISNDNQHEVDYRILKEVRSIIRKMQKSPSMMKENLPTYIWEYFNNRLKEKLDAIARDRNLGLDVIMWQDGMKQGVNIPKDTIIQVWTSKSHEIGPILRKGHRIIFSTCWYLDSFRRGVHWQNFYNCEPNEVDAEEGTQILGGEACLWSEYISSEMVSSMLWPRGSAVAEKLWSSRKPRALLDVSRRLSEHRCRMLRRGLDVGYANGPEYCVRKKTSRTVQSTQHTDKLTLNLAKDEIEYLIEKLRQPRISSNVSYVSAVADYTSIHLTSLFLSIIGVLALTLMMVCRKQRR